MSLFCIVCHKLSVVKTLCASKQEIDEPCDYSVLHGIGGESQFRVKLPDDGDHDITFLRSHVDGFIYPVIKELEIIDILPTTIFLLAFPFRF